mgnify:CR=1 FL=1|jgi:hypothetical protein
MSEIRVDTITEKTSANGVAIDGVTLKDNAVLTDTISEKTSANGVAIDSVTLKDGNVVVANGNGIDFSGTSDGTTMSSELLDDYEEGTFTPAFSGSSSAPSGVSYSVRAGSYTKIGRSVTCHVYLALSSWSSGPSGNAIVSALPFTSRNNNDSYAAGSIGYADKFISTDGPQAAYVELNTNQLQLKTNQSSDPRDDLRVSISASNMTGDEVMIVSVTYNVA